MNSGLYAACSGLVARMQALDTIASNVANSGSAGFRGEKNSFGTVLSKAHTNTPFSALNKATNTYSLLGSIHLDDTQGNITKTDNSLDVAIQGSGYFKVKTSTGMAYTRNGRFQADSHGKLTTMTGDAVLGDSGPITLPPGPVVISADGTITAGGAISGHLSVVDFAPGTALTHRGGGYYDVPAGTKEQPVTTSAIQQGALEDSNVDPISGVVQLITAQRAAESMRHAVTMLDTEMNKTAVQDLARVP